MSSLSNALIVVAIMFCLFLAACAEEGAKAADTNPPSLLSFDLDPREVDTGQSSQQITVTAHIIAKEGLNSTQAQFCHPFSNKKAPVSLKRVQGDETDGVYKGTLTLEKDSYPGTWRIEYIKMDDKPGNLTWLSGEDLVKSKFPAEFQVKMGIIWAWIWVLIIVPGFFFALLYTMYVYHTRDGEGFFNFPKNIKSIYIGYDKASSTSKCQFFLWTAAVFWAYLAIMSDRFFMHGQFDPAVQIPSNLILAMGLSSLTMLAAKGVTTSYAESGLVQKPENGPEAEAKSGSNAKANPEGKGGLFLDDKGKPDLSKIQIMGWTFIALGVFVGGVINIIRTSTLPQGLPDIDSTVLVLMGIGQGAYVGKKLVTKEDPDAPRLTALLPEEGGRGKPVKITGVNFKEHKPGSLITIDGKPCDIAFDQQNNIWKDGEITFKLPDKKPDGSEMKGDIKIGLMVGDKRSVNELQFKVS